MVPRLVVLLERADACVVAYKSRVAINTLSRSSTQRMVLRDDGPWRHRGHAAQSCCMARYQIKTTATSAVAIEMTDLGGRHDRLLGAVESCQSGQCSCPTDEYRKLESMSIAVGEDDIALRLEPKEGESFDLSEIAACLDYTTAQASQAEEGIGGPLPQSGSGGPP